MQPVCVRVCVFVPLLEGKKKQFIHIISLVTNCLKALCFKRFQFQSQTCQWNSSQRCRGSDYLLFSHSQTQNIVNYTLRFLLLVPFYLGAKLLCVKWLQGVGKFLHNVDKSDEKSIGFHTEIWFDMTCPRPSHMSMHQLRHWQSQCCPKISGGTSSVLLFSNIWEFLRVLHLKLVTETSKFNKKKRHDRIY